MYRKYYCLFASVFSFCALVIQAYTKPLRVGIFVDDASRAVNAIQQTLQDNGLIAETFNLGKDVDGSVFQDYDVIFFGGGWGGHNWLNQENRVWLVDFVEQRGGGAVFSMFRCGTLRRPLTHWSLSSIQPLFPEIAEGYTKVDTREINTIKTGHPLTQGIPETFFLPFWDHAVIRLGPHGQAIAVNSADETVIACGTAGDGRVVFIGPWIGIDIRGDDTYPMEGYDKQLLLNSVRWAGAGKQRDTEKTPAPDEAVAIKVLRRERIFNWTNDDPDTPRPPGQGLLMQRRNTLEEELKNLASQLNRFEPLVEYSDKAGNIPELQKQIAGLQDKLRENYKKAVEQKKLKISRMTLDELRNAPSPQNRKAWRAMLNEWGERLLPRRTMKELTEQVADIEKLLEPELLEYNDHQTAIRAL